MITYFFPYEVGLWTSMIKGSVFHKLLETTNKSPTFK